LKALEADASGAIALREVPALDGPTYARPATGGVSVGAREFRGEIETDFCVSSFSSLTAGASADVPDSFESSIREETEAIAPEGIHAFPAGTRSGLCLHEVFETLDFTKPETAESVCRDALRAYSLDPSQWCAAVSGCVQRVLATELAHGVTLGQVQRADRLVELEFHLPADRLDAESLGRLLEETDGEPPRFSPRRGWLRGFIDLVFRHEDRYYIVDWKSNRLGSSSSAYTLGNVQMAMMTHHYPLQARIYLAALHRYLGKRLLNYEYERHFGGVFYLFVRGVDPARPELGVWRYRPAEKAVRAFDDWLGGRP
jgi:exodeoxyribonuclease V beta subunit